MYIDDTFAFYVHGYNIFKQFLIRLNTIYKIKFVMELEERERLLFLGMLITKKHQSLMKTPTYRKQHIRDIFKHIFTPHLA